MSKQEKKKNILQLQARIKELERQIAQSEDLGTKCGQNIPGLGVDYQFLFRYFFKKINPFLCIFPKHTNQLVINQIPKQLFFAILALSIRFYKYEKIIDNHTLDHICLLESHFADLATQHIFILPSSPESYKHPDIHSIQAASIMACYLYATGKGEMPSHYVAYAQRAAQYIGLNFLDVHMEINPMNNACLDPNGVQVWRQIWWNCLQLDVLSASISGRPLAMDDEGFKVKYPGEDVVNPVYDRSVPYQVEHFYFFNYTAILTELWRSMYRFLLTWYHRKWLADPQDAYLSSQFMKYNCKLKEIYKTWDVLRRESLFDIKNDFICRNQVFIIQKIYHMLVIFLNRCYLAQCLEYRKGKDKDVTGMEIIAYDNLVEATTNIMNSVVEFKNNNWLKDIRDGFSPIAILNACIVQLNILYTTQCAVKIQHCKHVINISKKYLTETSQLWTMNGTFVNIIKLVERTFVNTANHEEYPFLNWNLTTNPSYLQWYFDNCSIL